MIHRVATICSIVYDTSGIYHYSEYPFKNISSFFIILTFFRWKYRSMKDVKQQESVLINCYLTQIYIHHVWYRLLKELKTEQHSDLDHIDQTAKEKGLGAAIEADLVHRIRLCCHRQGHQRAEQVP